MDVSNDTDRWDFGDTLGVAIVCNYHPYRVGPEDNEQQFEGGELT